MERGSFGASMRGGLFQDTHRRATQHGWGGGWKPKNNNNNNNNNIGKNKNGKWGYGKERKGGKRGLQGG